MLRRGAISYERNDAAAEYIRYLGDALAKRPHRQSHSILPELPSNKLVKLSVSRRTGRRGSIQQNTPSQCYKDLLKGSVLQSLGVEGQARMIQHKLQNVNNWDFDIFAFRRVTEGRPLYHMGLHLFQTHGLISELKLDILKVMKFLALIETAYHPDNCYHNCTHAADVTQALHCLISEPMLYGSLSPLELFASLVAAMCHDLDHPGVNQSFLLNTSSYLASIHGRHSLLERHHCHAAKAILKESQLLDHLLPDERQEVLSLMEDMILATDVSRNKDFMTQFEEMLVTDRGIDLSVQAQRHFLLMIAIKAADISNPSRCLHLSKTWSEQIMEEFFRQGDCERTMNLPISFLCDRFTTTIPKSQSGFFEFVALPLFKAWSKLLGSPSSILLVKNILNNKAYWDAQIPRNHSSDSEED